MREKKLLALQETLCIATFKREIIPVYSRKMKAKTILIMAGILILVSAIGFLTYQHFHGEIMQNITSEVGESSHTKNTGIIALSMDSASFEDMERRISELEKQEEINKQIFEKYLHIPPEDKQTTAEPTTTSLESNIPENNSLPGTIMTTEPSH